MLYYKIPPAEHIYEKVIDKSSAADYETPVVTTDIPVIPCSGFTTTIFSGIEMKLN